MNDARDPEAYRAELAARLTRLRGDLERLRSETARRSDELASRLAEEVELSAAVAGVAPAAAPVRPHGSGWTESIRRLDAAPDQVQALTRLLAECLHHASRAALLVERSGGLVPWRSAGFASPPERDSGRVLAEGLSRGVLDGSPLALRAGNEISRALGASDAARAVLVPFVVRERVAGAVYADAIDDHRLDPKGLAGLAFVAGLVVDRLSTRRLVPAPSLRPFEGATEWNGGRGLGGPLAPGEGDPTDEARRFARLLASEIRLYNPAAVLEGVERGNVSAALREEIERGRRLYEERVPAGVRAEADYYSEALVDVLAGGNPALLGRG